jgi:hypothetical protein
MLIVTVGVLAVAVGMLQGAAFGGTHPPKISSVKPAKAEAGDIVRIYGAHFEGITAVKFNGINARFTVDSSKKIRALVPGAATTGPISVLTATETATSKDAFKVLVDVPFADCLKSGTAAVPVGTEPYIGVGWQMSEKSYLKKFLKSTTTTLTVNGVPVNKPSKFWDKHGDPAGVGDWATYWGYEPGLVLAHAGDTISFVFHVVATKAFSDGFKTYAAGAELFTGSTCTVHAA